MLNVLTLVGNFDNLVVIVMVVMFVEILIPISNIWILV